MSKMEYWVCPQCKYEQNTLEKFDWCGKNLKCNNCGTGSYYSEWNIIERETITMLGNRDKYVDKLLWNFKTDTYFNHYGVDVKIIEMNHDMEVSGAKFHFKLSSGEDLILISR